MAAFLGMRGSDDWITHARPENWREMILFLYPNGMAPLTAIMSKMRSEAIDDPVFHWFLKLLPDQRGAVTHIYTDVLSTLYVSGGVATNTLYVKMAEADCDKIRVDHILQLRDASDPTMICVAKVSAVTKNGASSYATVQLLESDDNSTQSHTLADADVFLIVGNANEEGADTPNVIAYDPTEVYNYLQIFRTPTSITNTAKVTHLRTGDPFQENRREALELHSIEMEKAFLFGIRYATTGSLGFPKRYTAGIRSWITTNVGNYPFDTNFSGNTWIQGGEEWLDTFCEQVFRYGKNQKLVLAGSGALLGIQKLVKNAAQMTLTGTVKSYGIEVTEWRTVFGTLNVITHPLFSYEATLRNSMCFIEPQKLTYKYLRGRDTNLLQNRQGRGIDGQVDEYLTEAGLELSHEQSFAWCDGVGLDNAL
jgi:hypothetical protein